MAIFSAFLLLAAASGAAPCAAPKPLEEPWTSWTQSWRADAGTGVEGAPALLLGKPVIATLSPGDYVQLTTEPGPKGNAGFAGIFTLSVKQQARVGIALSDAAWVDVVDGATPVKSAAHGHGPECSGIRKIVWFDLRAGRHIVQVTGSKTREIRIMAADALANQPR